MSFRKSCFPTLLTALTSVSLIFTCLIFSDSAQCQRVVTGVRMVAPGTQLVTPIKSGTIQSPSQVPASQQPAKPAKGKSEKDKLVDLLLATKLERNAQSILKSWSEREPEIPGQSEIENRQFDAKVENLFESILVLSVEDPKGLQPGGTIVLKKGSSEVSRGQIISVDDSRVVVNLTGREKEEPNDAPDTSPATENDKSKPSDSDVAPKQQASGQNVKDQNDDAQDDTAKNDDAKSEDTKDDQTSGVEKTDSKTNAESAIVQVNQSDDSNDSNQDKVESNAGDSKPKIAKVDLKAGEAVTIHPVNKNDSAQAKAKTIQLQAKAFSRMVTLGQWDEVKKFLSQLEPADADKVYTHLLTSLASTEPKLPEGIPEEIAQQVLAQMQQGGQPMPSSHLTPDDILQISEASPNPIRIQVKSEDESKIENSQGTSKSANPKEPPVDPTKHLDAIANLVRIAKVGGHDFLDFVEKLNKGTSHFGSQDRIKRLTAADLLMRAGLTEFVEGFLPKLDDDATRSDLPALKIWSQLALAQYNSKRVAQWLQTAWQVNQWIVNHESVDASDKDLALTSLIELSPQVDKELGQEWLNASFTDEPQRGMMILSNLGSKSAMMAEQAAMTSESERLKLLRLQNNAAENLIDVAPESTGQWQQALTLLVKNWIKEAETSIQYSKQNSRREFMQIDMYGNYYWVDQDQFMRMRGGVQQPRPIKLGDILEVAPSPDWQKVIDPSLHTKLKQLLANLHLRINEEDDAFPYIEQLATTHPVVARDLIHEFLRIWTRNHDPNTDRRQRNPYIYFYGFDQKAEAIPLTRSKQERNLAELSGWVERIRKLPIQDIDEQLLANAFTTCHSSAEVFRIEAVKSVFGELENLKPETIAAICQKMRVNLSSGWRDVRTQEAKQTNRREPEVQQEVLRGYQVGLALAAEALNSSPDNWQLHLAIACLMYEENAYSQTVQKSSEFSDRRDRSFDQFQLAAEKYRDVVMTLEEKDQSTDVFDYWFYAALGACDLGKVTDKTVPDLRQYAKIRAAIESLPGSLAESHMGKVANNMFTRMSPIKPEIKFRYLRGGFEIVGDHPRAWEARNLYDYYRDLVSEIKFSVEVDGTDNVGHKQPFGVFVNIIHTTEIERESGGFGKYVQNQNNMQFAFNYGRPTEDYRDKFNDAVSQALGEHFEIASVTFQNPDSMKSRPAAREGWRVTPYAYLLLKPNGPEVDRIAPLKLDMDFLDTSGYVVVPIESPAVVIDCSDENGEPRPVSDLEITQTLDERMASDGKLVLEVSATGKGLVPELSQLVDTRNESFEVVNVDDQGVLPTSFDPNSNDIQVISDRSWTIEYRAKDNSKKLNEFTFNDSIMNDAAMKFQRYEDVDIVAAEQTVQLERSYAKFSWAFLYWLVPLIFVGIVGGVALFVVLSRPKEQKVNQFDIPEEINPFTVLTLLKDIKHRNGINDLQATELQESIYRIERFYFDDASEERAIDLNELAERWVARAK